MAVPAGRARQIQCMNSIEVHTMNDYSSRICSVEKELESYYLSREQSKFLCDRVAVEWGLHWGMTREDEWRKDETWKALNEMRIYSPWKRAAPNLR